VFAQRRHDHRRIFAPHLDQHSFAGVKVSFGAASVVESRKQQKPQKPLLNASLSMEHHSSQ
jgi:hypothetical protein